MAGAWGSTDKVNLYLRPALEPWREREGQKGKQETSFASPRVVKREKEKGKRRGIGGRITLGRWR